MASQFSLLQTRRFLPMFLTQFLGALNDNVFKQALILLFTYQAASLSSLSPSVLNNLSAMLFILPYFLFSATAGQIAEIVPGATCHLACLPGRSPVYFGGQ